MVALLLASLLGVALAAPAPLYSPNPDRSDTTLRAMRIAGVSSAEFRALDDRRTFLRIFDLNENRVTDGPFSVLSPEQVNGWAKWAHYASAIYCGLERINSWTCGEDCCAVPGTTLASGGDNGATPLWYVADTGSEIVVAVAGTSSDPASLAVDLDYKFTPLEAAYFPGITAQVHRGFYGAFKRMADPILAAVKDATASGKEVTVTGHSLGAAVGMLLSVYLTQHLCGIVNARLIAAPRVGDPDWANAVDNVMGKRQEHITNYNDIVPQIPFLQWGFRHPSGEVYITAVSGSEYRLCEGQENKNCGAQWADVEGGLGGMNDYLNNGVHSGPFAGVNVTSGKCAK